MIFPWFDKRAVELTDGRKQTAEKRTRGGGEEGENIE